MFRTWRSPATALLTFALSWLLASTSAHANIRVIEVLGASLVEGLEPDENGKLPANVTIYAGVAGDETSGVCGTEAKDGLNPCNNCPTDSAAWGEACNERMVYPSLQLRITFVNEGEPGQILLTGTTSEGSTIDTITTNPAHPHELAGGETGTLSVLWTDICGFSETGVGGDSSCSTDRTNYSLRLGVDRDGSGWLEGSEYKLLQIRIVRSIGQDGSGKSWADDCSDGTVDNSLGGLCYFEVYPGDQKVFISRYIGPSTLPTNFSSIKIFCKDSAGVNYSPTGFTAISPADICASIQLTATTSEEPDAELIDGLVKGLSNDVGYYFRVGTADKAGNIGYFSDPAHDEACAEGAREPCKFAVPAKVEGVLSDDMNCFIATAAFGSPLDPKVADFRKFRNQVLLKSEWGRAFVQLYYKLSPPAAQVIAAHPVLKKLTQVTLWPLWALSQLYLWSPIAMVISLLLLIALPIVLVRYRWRREWMALFILFSWSAALAQNHPNEPPYTLAPEPGFERAPMSGQSNTKADSDLPATSRGFAIKGGAFRPTEITNENTGVTFSDIYGERKGPIIFVDYDFLLAKPLGQLHFKLGWGVYASMPSNGRFVSNAPSNQNLESMEKFTYIIFPNTATFQYKLQYSPSQWFVPYGEGGAGYFAFMEVRDDKFSPKLGGAPVAVAGGGLQILIDNIDPYSTHHLRMDYGIQHVWLVVDYKYVEGLHDKYDFTSSIINGGLYFEF